jgi:hypothetical protein
MNFKEPSYDISTVADPECLLRIRDPATMTKQEEEKICCLTALENVRHVLEKKNRLKRSKKQLHVW